MFALTAALLVMAPGPPVTPVDFHLAGQPARVTGLGSTTPPGAPITLAPPTTTEGSSETDSGNAGDDQAAHTKARFFIAHGFGRGVPLSFAVRQVVPARVRVSFGPGVDSTRTVTWQGGKPWDDVLRAAVAPLGFHLVMSHMAVKIIE